MSTISYRHQERLHIGQIAGAIAATGFVALGIFQSMLAFGAPLGHAAWGGAQADLTSGQRIGSAISVVVYAAAAAVVLSRVGLSNWPRTQRLLIWTPAVLAGLLAIGAVANFASQSHWENYLLGPTAVVLTILCVIVARSPMTSR